MNLENSFAAVSVAGVFVDKHRTVTKVSEVGNIVASRELSETDLGVMEWLVENIASVAIIAGGVLPYVPQYLSIKRTRNSEGFSTTVCLTLLIASILRILFWFGRHFELPLLIQSFIMSGVMLSLVKLCVETRPGIGTTRLFTDFRVEDFWNWTDFLSYLQFLAVFVTIASLLTYLFVDSPVFIESLGLTALLVEATLAIPQLLHNARVKSTAGMSVSMVLLWTAGDIGKSLYFVLRDTPKQFWLCGFTQVVVDIVILMQVAAYRPVYK